MLKLVIFDHDGLMVNSEEVVHAAISDIFAEYGHDFTWEYFTQHIGMSVSESLQISYKDFPLSISFAEFYERRNSKVAEYIENRLELMPGLVKLLTHIKELRIPIAIATSGKREYILKNLKKFNIEKYFSTIVTIEEVNKGKPYPDLILKVLERTMIKANDAIMLEDSPHGIEASYRAGVFSIAIPSKGMDYNRFKKADMICDSLEKVAAVTRAFTK